MAARTQELVTLRPMFATDAAFRAWVNAFHDILLWAGLIQTADTGQINTATVVKPAGPNGNQGYSVWRFNDALQGAAPIFIKFEFGASSGWDTDPQIWVTVGSATDGAGNLSGKTFSRLAYSANINDSANPHNSYQSAAPGRFAILLHRRNGDTSTGNFFLAIERSMDAAGAYTAEGFRVVMSVSSGGQRVYHWGAIHYAVTSAQLRGQGAAVVMNSDEASGLSDGNQGIYSWCLCSRRGTENPLSQVFSYHSSDALGDTQLDSALYGAALKVMTLGGNAGAPGSGLNRAAHFGNNFFANACLAMRYD